MSDNQLQTDERRQETRLETYLESVLEQKEHTIYTTVINLSEQGVGFLSARPFKKGEVVNINLSFHKQNIEPITLKVRVQSCREVDLEYYIGGVIISKTDEFERFYAAIPQVY
ncbi:hypothetical protein MNBD_GAMMA04-2134 [hydrothermal vent metagenome]|uniref:PilZ domain-containing protein n=1 Tax=hydrothermal vent metagenome TaxID=652676 RepID=A0A3B0WCD3_9ZZZZ